MKKSPMKQRLSRETYTRIQDGLRARMAAEGDDVDEIVRVNGLALSPDDPVPGR